MTESLSSHGPTMRPTIHDILVEVGDHFGVTVDELCSARRVGALPMARGVAVEVARRHTIASYPEIAHAMSHRNHSTVITAHQRHQRRARLNLSQADAAAINAVIIIEQKLGVAKQQSSVASTDGS